MQFHVDGDAGDAVFGWVVPDNPSATPELLVSAPPNLSLKFSANVFRQDIKDLGIHNTGMVGFHIDSSLLPGLSASDEVEIRDAESNILIFRRFRPHAHLRMKLMRYELTAMPQIPVDAALASRFTLPYQAVERYSYETMFGLINNQAETSIYMSGRPFLTRYMQLLRDREFKIVVMLRDPIEELAERLVFLKFAASGNSPDFLVDHMTGLDPLLELVQRVNFNDDNSLASAMNALSENERDAISNPHVRILACSKDEIADSNHVSIALENLANLDLVGVQSHFDRFKTELALLIGSDLIGDQKMANISTVPAIAQKLGRLRVVHRILNFDIKLYRFACEAIEKAYA
jgi:hypothetical protein